MLVKIYISHLEVFLHIELYSRLLATYPRPQKESKYKYENIIQTWLIAG